MPSNLCCSSLCATTVSNVTGSQSCTCSIDLTLIAASQDIVDPNRSSWVSYSTLINNNCIGNVPNGHVAFICETLVPVVSVNNCWLGFDGRWANPKPKQLWAWGANTCGRLGTNTVTAVSSPVQEITSSTNWCLTSAGTAHSSGLKTDGTLWSWGSNQSGPLGNNSVIDRSSPVQEITSATNWCQLNLGGCHTVALKTDGTLWLWGCNNAGQLGNNDAGTDRSSPIREISSSTTWCKISAGCCLTASIKNDGSLWIWGRGACGALGDNAALDRSSPVREITSSTTWCQVGVGVSAGAVKTDGGLWTWGINNCGQLGTNTIANSSSPVREITSAATWCQTSAGDLHTIALKTDGTLWSWGRGGCGLLGTNNTTPRSSPVQEATSSTTWCLGSAGTDHTAAIRTTGSLWAWGINGSGRLGDNTTTVRLSPVQEITSSTSWCQTKATWQHTVALKL